MTDYLAEAVTAQFGERCPDFAEGCHCCEAWKQYDEWQGAVVFREVRAGRFTRDFDQKVEFHPRPDAEVWKGGALLWANLGDDGAIGFKP